MQTGSASTPAASTGETDSHADAPNTSAPNTDRLVYVDGAGETDSYSGDRIDNDYVQTGTLVFAAPSSGETDAFGIEQQPNAISLPEDIFVYVDGSGETDQAANVADSNDFDPGVRLTWADIANAQATGGGVQEDRLVFVEAGETDQAAGIESLEVTIFEGTVYVLLRQPDVTPDVA